MTEAEAAAAASAVSTVDEEDEICDAIIAQLPPPSTLAGCPHTHRPSACRSHRRLGGAVESAGAWHGSYRLSVIEFEKDDDTNFHVEFITACSNLRAINFAYVC